MAHILIVSATFYEDIAASLLEGAVKTLAQEKVGYQSIEVPGALEIPQVIRYGINRRRFDGFIALGAVIRGETSHYDIVTQESARGVMELALQHQAPIGNGILTTDTRKQAEERADPNGKNKGGDAAHAVLNLIHHQKLLHG